MAKEQKIFDFSARDRLLCNLLLPKSVIVSDRSVSAIAIKAVLFRIHQHMGSNSVSWPGIKLIAKSTQLGEKTVRRAIEALEMLQIITVRRRSAEDTQIVCNHYSINWLEIANRQTYEGHPEAQLDDLKPDETEPTNRPLGTERVATEHRPIGHVAPTNRPLGGRLTIKKQTIKHSFHKGEANEHESLKMDSWQKKTIAPNIQIRDLTSPDKLDQLWELARANEHFNSHCHNTLKSKISFFALAHAIHRKRAGFGESPIGFFLKILKQRQEAWVNQYDDADSDWAESAIKILDRQQSDFDYQRQKQQPLDPEAIRVREMEQNRMKQVRELQEAMKRGEI